MTNVSTPSSLSVKLRTDEERTRWEKLARMQVEPTKYVDPAILEKIEIADSFWALADRARVSMVLKGTWPSYRRMMLEFLSTLELHKAERPRQVQGISFRLKNKSFKITVEELRCIFGSTGDYYDEHPDYQRDEFWRAITLFDQGERHVYNTQSSKTTRIRNPVMRLFCRALAFGPFARKEGGVVQTAELFMLHCAPQGYGVNVGAYIATSLARAASRASGTLMCGGMISVLADYVGVNSSSWEEVSGGRLLSYESLHPLLEKCSYSTVKNRSLKKSQP